MTKDKKLYNLSILMQKKDITQLNLSSIIEVSQETISAYLNGKAKPSVATLLKLANFFDTSTDYILGRTDIGFKSEDMKSLGMNENELKLLSQYRKLSEKDKEKVVGYIDGIQQK